jgi:hypothetical protein
MKSLRDFFKGLPGGHRPPTGPMTTSEANDAEQLREETAAKDQERADQEEAAADPESGSPAA